MMYLYYRTIWVAVEAREISARRALSMLNRKARQLGYFNFRNWLNGDQ